MSTSAARPFLLRLLAAAGVTAAVQLAPLTTPAAAQYFGRNKVQYEAFRFEVLKTPHFEIYFYPEERAGAALAARLAERWYARHSAALGHHLRGIQPVILYASHPHFEQTNAISGDIDESTGGVTEALRRRVVLPLAGPLAETDHVLGHELVHAFQYDITGQGRGGAAGIPTAARLPLWFIEGMAEYMSIGPVDPNTTMWLRDAAARHRLPTYRQLDDPRYFPYRYGEAFLAFLASRYGDGVLGNLLRAAGRAGDISRALTQVTGQPPDSLVRRWHSEVEETYAVTRRITDSAAAFAKLLEGGRREANYNLAPALSPDGARVAFFSERGLFSIDLFLADIGTGRVLKTLVKTALDPHYESLGFINSAGAWDASGKRFAFGAIARGRPVLSVLDVERDRVVREIRFPTLGEIFTPTWSPDGNAIAFSALVGGFTDLFVCDIATGRLRRLTTDAYADLQPAWSPDGRTIAFVTDRFTTDLATLASGSYRLALLRLESGEITPLPAFRGAKHINPQWSPDGTGMYFLSDRGGITNVYRLDLAAGTTSQLTNLATGASGITAISPALSVASRTGRLVFTTYERGSYNLYAVDRGEALAGMPLTDLAPTRAAILPPTDAPDAATLARLTDPVTGLPPETTFAVAAYHPKLSLEGVIQPTLAVGVDQFGTYVGGGTTLLWGDLLGDHTVITGFQVNGSLRDLSAVVGYQNLTHRWNWSIVGQQVPYVTGQFAAGFGLVGSDTAYIQQTLLARQTNRAVTAAVAYPFSRVQRVELSAGFQNIGFSQELRTQAFDVVTSQLLLDTTEHLPSPRDLNFGVLGAALVYDNSFFGATSPILGQRYRLDVSPMIGSLNLTNVIVDYRRYIMPARPWTLAARVMHVGRYGRDAEDPRLSPLFLGYPSLVRGYNTGSFDASECPTDPNAGCPAFDRLLGTRMLVGNAELRFPLLGVLGVGSGYYGAFPIEAAIFADGGVAWVRGNEPTFLGGGRSGVASAGAALRLNLLGYAIGEVDFVRPFQRPGKGWYWEFSLAPGF